jgi:hypothetical protein
MICRKRDLQAWHTRRHARAWRPRARAHLHTAPRTLPRSSIYHHPPQHGASCTTQLPKTPTAAFACEPACAAQSEAARVSPRRHGGWRSRAINSAASPQPSRPSSCTTIGRHCADSATSAAACHWHQGLRLLHQQPPSHRHRLKQAPPPPVHSPPSPAGSCLIKIQFHPSTTVC